MEIMKVKNYKAFAEMLKERTGCEVKIKLMKEKDHIHYQLNKDGLSLGVLCVQDGEPSFAPFCTFDNDGSNDHYINIRYMPLLDDFIGVLKVFGDMFVCEEGV